MANRVIRGVARDSSGNAVSEPTVTVYETGTAVLATIFSDAAGTAKANPFTGDADGEWEFFVPANEAVKVKVEKTGFTTWEKDFIVAVPAAAQIARTTAQFDATSATLSDVSGLTFNVEAGRTYEFVARIHWTETGGSGGVKYAISGTATATTVIYHVRSFEDAAMTTAHYSRTALGSATLGHMSAAVSGYTDISGTITVNAAGTLLVQFAQGSASGTSSVKVGSTFQLQEIA